MLAFFFEASRSERLYTLDLSVYNFNELVPNEKRTELRKRGPVEF
jgi:hypothetical protein